jgi:hypothetical protein
MKLANGTLLTLTRRKWSLQDFSAFGVRRKQGMFVGVIGFGPAAVVLVRVKGTES